MTQPIWYDSTEAGAPTLNNVAGSLLEVLRSCLVTGFNAKTVTSIAVASGLATATCAAHGFLSTYGKLVQISGAPEALLNGNQQPLTVATNTFTFAAPGVADGTYTGTISAKRAPLGWSEPYTGTNVAMFARTVPEATAMMLRVNDTGVAPSSGVDTRAIMVESATGIDSFSGLTPLAGSLPDGQYWSKGPNTAAAKTWAVFGDDRFFYYAVEATNQGPLTIMCFGDIVSFKSADAYHAVICGSPSVGVGSPPAFMSAVAAGSSSNTNAFRIARRSDQITVANGVACHSMAISNVWMGSTGPAYPSAVDGGMVLARPLLVSESNVTGNHPFRGIMPGAAAPVSPRPFASLSVQSGFLGDPSTYVVLSAGSVGQVLIDVGASWR